MQKLKKPVSILLVFMMIVSLFAIVPITASAEVGDIVPESDYLTFTAVEAGASVTLNVPTGNSFQYNINNSGWQSYTVGSLIALEKGDSVRFRGKDTAFNASNHVSIDGKVACSGNVMSLRLDEDGRDQGLSYGCFNYMFSDCAGLISAPELPETTLASHCYECMFFGCTNLTVAPELPATALATGCYSSMFAGCTSLTTAPELPATTLATGCYERMFYACRSLTTAPELPATTLERNCYSYMFAGCERLTTAPELPATTLESGCYNAMFYRCSSIKLSETQTAEYSIPYSVPSGGDGTTATNALNKMFYGTGGTFTGGTPEINKTYYLYREVPKYTVTWQNEDGTTLETDENVAEGTTPSYDGTTPEKADDENNTYTFAGWSPAIAPVTEDVTYTAQFDATPKTPAAGASYVKVTSEPQDWSGEYLIVYEDEDGSTAFNGSADELNSSGNYIDVTISGGEIASDAATDAAKVTIAQIDGGYSIKAANKYIGGTSGSSKNIAISDEAIVNMISLDDDDYAVIESNSKYFRYNTSWSGFRYYASGQQPVCLYKYTEPEAPTTYTVTWQNEDGTTLKTDKVEEDTTPTYDGATPTKAADGDHMYVFSGWTPELAPVTEDVTYTATFASSADLVEITDHETDLADLGIDIVMSEWGRSMTAQEAITLAQYMSAQNDGAKCAVLYEVVDDYELQYAMSDGTTGDRSSFYSYTLNDFLPDYKVYYLPVNLNPETIELNLNPDNATVIWYDATDSDGYWSMEAAYNDSCYLVLKGNSNQPAGTYEWADMGSGCGVSDIDASQNIDFVDGSCTVTVDEDVVTVSGTFTGRDRNTYVVTVTYEAPYYTITDESVNGAVTAGVNGADVTKAKAGKTVLLNVAPADGYQLKSITASAQKTTPEDFSDLVALMGDAVFDGDENYDCGGYTCKVENGKFVVYNGANLLAELSESNKTGFNSDSDYVEVNSEDALWGFFVENGEITEIDVTDTNDDYIFSSVSGSKSTGTLQPVQVGLTTVAEGSQYSFTMPAKNVTVKAEFEAIPKYTVTWKNGDTVLETDTDVAEGTTPTYDGEPPYKADGANCIYTFSGWTPEVSAVTGDATYTAQFTESEKPEAIKDCNNKYGDFRLYSNVPIVSFSNVNDLLTGAIIPITYGDSNTMIPVQDAKGYSYKFYDQTGTEIPAQIASSSSAPGSNYELSDDVTVYTNVINFTRPAGCTAIYIVATAPAVDLFPQHSITLGGNIGVNFYIDSAAADFANASTAVVKFTWDGGGEDRTKEVDLTKLTPDGDGYYKATVDVVAAQMAHKIHAEVYLNGKKLEQTDDYSVKEYAETVFKNPEKYDSEKPEQLKALAQALLNYGANAQTVFYDSLKEHPALANKTVGNNGYEGVTAEQIGRAIKGSAFTVSDVETALGAKFYTSSLIYLSRNTLRLYFTPTTYPGEMPNADAYAGNLSGYYYYVDVPNIPAAELDNQQTFNVNGTKFTFSALDYAKAVVESTKMEPEQQNLAKSLYLYNQAANAYFDAAPAPVENVVDLGTLEGDYEAQDGDVLTGKLVNQYKITIADGATVTLKDADITCLSSNTQYDGIALLGDATILLEGENTVKGGYKYNAGIFVPEEKTLTIDGTGSLNVSSGGSVAAIGAKRSSIVNGTLGGNIVINGGTINATGGNGGAGIGGCTVANCGTITINGGTVTAVGNDSAPGIGSGNRASYCAGITITGGTVTATGNKYAAGIGSGNAGSCGNITIAATVTQVTATKGYSAPNSIGAGKSGSCGTVTIEDGANVTQN